MDVVLAFSHVDENPRNWWQEPSYPGIARGVSAGARAYVTMNCQTSSSTECNRQRCPQRPGGTPLLRGPQWVIERNHLDLAWRQMPIQSRVTFSSPLIQFDHKVYGTPRVLSACSASSTSKDTTSSGTVRTWNASRLDDDSVRARQPDFQTMYRGHMRDASLRTPTIESGHPARSVQQ